MAISRVSGATRARPASLAGRVGSTTVGGGDRRGLVARLTPPFRRRSRGGFFDMATVLRTALALAAAAAVLAVVLTDATAQTVVPVLVSNEGRPSETALATASGRVSYAQSFRTGDHADGYFLSSVELGLAVESGVSVEAKLLRSTALVGTPGEPYRYPPINESAVVLSPVSTPDDDASTLKEFAALDVLLEPGTQYWIVVTKTAGADGGLSVGTVVDGGRIDAGRAAGWSVGDNVWADVTTEVAGVASTEWADYSGSAAVSMRIRLRGSEAVRPELGPYVTNRHGGYRAAVAKTSSSDTKYATAFTTGARIGGLELTSVVLGVAAESGATPRVAIHADNSGSPAATAVTGGTLNTPTIASTDLDLPGRAVFSAASAISLDASEKYWVVLDVGTGSGQVSVSTTTADASALHETFVVAPPRIDETLRRYDGSSWSVDGAERLFRMAVGGPTDQYSSSVSVGAPQVGVGVTAEVKDKAGRLRNVSFQWQRGAAEEGPFVDIPALEGGTADRYIPLPGDLGMWLNAIETYDNAFVKGKTVQSVSLTAVLSQPVMSNVGLISDITYIVDGPALTKLAQPFTTGPEPSGYVLRGIRARIAVEAAVGEDISVAWALHADDNGEFRPAPAPLFDPIDIPVDDIVAVDDMVTGILELAHPGFVLAPGARYWLVLSWTHTNLPQGAFFTRSLSEYGDGPVFEDGLSPLDPGSAAGWKMEANALTYNTVDPPDPPRWRPHAVALDVIGRFALQMSVLADTATGPAAPSRLEASQGDARVGLFWFAPVTDGGSAITHYEYRYQAGTGSYGAWTQVPDSDNDGDFADERKLVVSSLTNDVAHVFEIRAVNSAPQGAGPPAVSRSLTPLEDIPTLSVTVTPEKATGGIDYVTYTITRSGPTTDALRVDYRMVPPEGNDWGSINTLEDYRDLLTNIAVRTVVYRLDDAPENSVGFSASATVGGTLEVQVFADGYDSIDAAAPLEVVVVEDPAWVVSFEESSYAFDEASDANSITALMTATSTDMPAPWRKADGTVGGISFKVLSNGRTATVAVDYETVAETLTPDVDSWAANADGYMEGSVEVELTLLDDAVVESDEELLLYFVEHEEFAGLAWLAYRGADGQMGRVVGTSRNVPVTIRDDDAALSSVSVNSTPLLPLDAAIKDTYGRNEAIVFAVQFSAEVVVTGMPEFTFVLDATNKQAEYSGGSGTDMLTFSYTVQLADADDDGISWAANSVALAGGTINRAGTSGAAVLTHSLQADSSGHKVDGSMVSFSAPQFAADAAPRSVAENTASGNVGAPVAAVDPDGDAVYHSVLATAATAAATAHLAAFHRHFELAETSGQITVRAGSLLNYEDRSSYVVRIEATDREDADGMAESAPYTVDDTLTLTITLNNVDEDGTVTISGSPIAGQTLTASVSDPDGSVGVLSYQWSRSSSQNSGFSDIADADQSSYVVQDGDEGMYLRVTIEYADVHTSVKSEHATTTRPAAANAPENLSAAPGDRRVALSWDDPGDATIDRYQYRYRNTSDSDWRPDWTDIAASDAATTSHTLAGLTNGVEYTFQVRRMYLENGQDDPGAHGDVKSIPRGALGAPANLSAVSAGDGEIALSWDDPGDITISGYQFRLRLSSASAWSPDWADFAGSNAATTSHTLSGLDNDVRYTVEVRALRDGVGGPASSGSATPRGPLRAPAGFTATPGDSRVELSWDATDDDSVSGYQYRRRLSSATAWSPDWTDVAGSNAAATSHTLTGLVNNVRYTVEVRALRDGVGGPPSRGGATPRGPLRAPAGFTATPGDSRVELSWDATDDDSVSGYQYRRRLSSATAWSPDWTDVAGSNAATTSHTLSGLVNNVRYTVEVRALRDGVGGPASSGSATPRGPLRAPAGFTATPGDSRVELSWDATDDDSVSGYQYRRRLSSDAAWSPDWTDVAGSNAATTSHTLSGLVNNVRYTVEVRALRDGVGGPASSGSATPRGPLRAPAGFTATPGDSRVELSWDATDDDSVSGYQYRRRLSSATAWSPDWADIAGSNAATTSHTLTGLDNNVRYTVEVRALRVSVGGPASRSSATPRGPLRAPASFTATPGDTRVELSWDATDDDSVSGYQYRRRLSSDAAWSPDWTDVAGSNAATTSHTLSGLVNNVRYTVEVRALRDGVGGPASRGGATPRGPLRAPAGFTATPGDSRVELSWDATDDDSVSGYQYRRRLSSATAWSPDWADIAGSNAATTSHTLSGLVNNVRYTVEVRALRDGVGGPASRGSATPRGPLRAPASFTATPATAALS